MDSGIYSKPMCRKENEVHPQEPANRFTCIGVGKDDGQRSIVVRPARTSLVEFSDQLGYGLESAVVRCVEQGDLREHFNSIRDWLACDFASLPSVSILTTFFRMQETSREGLVRHAASALDRY
jgi:hypothetical protein